MRIFTICTLQSFNMFQPQLLVVLAVFVSLISAATIPIPSGPYGVTLRTTQLINPAMLDPWAPSKSFRHIMVSVFYPTINQTECRQKTVPYMPPSTASFFDQMYSTVGLPDGSFKDLELTICDVNITAKRPKLPPYPIILFSPGLGNSRLIYSAIAQSLSSQGFVVITIDHPYDAAVAEFPDGSLVLAANITTDIQITAALEVRRKDVSFLVDQLHNTTVTQSLFAGLHGSLDLKKIQVYGHSLGGAAAAAAILHDGRIRGGINLDGSFFGSVLDKGLDRPFMIFAHQGKNESTDQSWAKVWPLLSSSKVEVTVRGTQHGSYTDFPFLLKVLGLGGQLLAQLEEEVGTIDGGRMLHILTTYTKAFFAFVGGRPPFAGLQRPTKDFPEVEVVHSRFIGRCE